jgi:hypothetical protein
VADGALSQSKVDGLSAALAAKANLAGGAAFTGSVTVEGAAVITSVTNSTVADSALSIGKVSGLQTALDGKQGAGALGLTVAGVTAPVATNPRVDWTVDSTTQWRLQTDASGGALRLQRRAGLGLEDAVTVNQGNGDVALASRLLAPLQPYAYLRFNNGEAIVGGGQGSQGKMVPGTTVHNVGDLWSAAQGRFNVPVSGLYAASLQLAPQNRSSTNLIVSSLRVNGTTTIAEQQTVYAAVLSVVYNLAAGDYVEIFASSPSGATTTHVTAALQSYVSFALLH